MKFKRIDYQCEWPGCDGSGEILDKKTRVMGYTGYDTGDDTDEKFIHCPLCKQVEAQLISDQTAHDEWVKRAISFIESYFVTTIHLCGVEVHHIHHIDEPEWDKIKEVILRLLEE